MKRLRHWSIGLGLGLLCFSFSAQSQFLTENFESGSLGQFQNPAESDSISELSTTLYNGGTTSSFTPYGNSDTVILQSVSVDLSMATSPLLSFWHIAKLEGGYDIGYVKVSSDNGATWNTLGAGEYLGTSADFIATGEITEDNYSDWGTSGTDVLDNTMWKEEVFNLSAYTGSSSVLIRFEIIADGVITREGWYIDDISVNDPSCAIPTGLTVSNLTTSSADVTWSGTASEYILEYGPLGFVPGTGTEVTGLTSASYSFNSLSTTYDVYVRAVCGLDTSFYSTPVAVSPLLNALSLPVVEDFESANPVFINQPGNISSFAMSTTLVYNGDSTVYLDYDNNDNSALILNGSVDLTNAASPALTFAHIAKTEGSYDEGFIEYSLDEGATWSVLPDSLYFGSSSDYSIDQRFDEDSYSAWGTTNTTVLTNADFRQEYFSLEPFIGESSFTLRFRLESDGSATREGWYIDDISIADGACPPVSGLTANANGVDITVNWNSTASNFNVEYGPSGFTPGSGTVASTSDDSLVITGLAPASDFDFYVTADCGTSTSIAAGPVTATTACAVLSTPFNESFDNSSIPNCWTNNGPENWLFSTGAGYGAANADDHTGNGGNYAWIDGSGTGDNLEIGLETPEIDITGLTDPVLSFFLFSNNENNPGDNNLFRVEGWDGTQWVNLYSYSGDSADWVNVTIDLTNANLSDTTKFRFEVDEVDSIIAYYNDILIDDVAVYNNVLAPFDLLTPPDQTFVLFDGFTDEFATATWQEALPNATYEWLATDPSNPDFSNPLVTVPTGTDEFLDIDYGSMDSVLAQLGFNVGDTAYIAWTVRATEGANTILAADTFLLLAERGNVTVPLSDFDLLSPVDGATLDIAGLDISTATINWESTSYIPDPTRSISYEWLADVPGGNFSNPLATIPASDTSLTLTLGEIDGLLSSLGVANGDSIDIIWTVRSNDGSGNEKLATSPHDLKLKRSGIYTLGGAQYPASIGTSANYRGPASNRVYHRSNTIYPSTELADIPVGTPITHIGFSIETPSTNPVSGDMKLYLRSTSDATNTDSTTWSGVLTNQTNYYDGPLTIPNTAGYYFIALQTPYIYDGNGIYLAWDWEVTSSTSSPEITYDVNTSISAGIVRATSNISAPTSLDAPSSFRPVVFWGYEPADDDLAVIEVYGLGKVPLENGSPQEVSALVTNRGKNAVTNADVTLEVNGATTFTDVQQVTLFNGDTTLVTFNTYNVTATGNNDILVRVDADDVGTNDSAQYAQEVTENTWAYAESGYFDGSVGFNTGSGLLLNKYYTNGKAYVGAVNITFGNNPESVGNIVYPVVLDASGNIVEEGDDYTITAADTASTVTFMLDTPRVFENDSFYVGLAQTAATPGYFPVAFQDENPTRSGAFFSASLDGSNAAEIDFRMMIEAVTSPVITDFELLSPADGTTLVVTGQPTATVDINWEGAESLEGDIEYTWLLDVPGNDFSNPLLAIPANNSGVDTVLTLTNNDIATALSGLGFGIGDTVQTIWTVVAEDDSSNAQFAVSPFYLTIVRDTLITVRENAIENFNLYPNPNNGEFSVSMNMKEAGAISMRVTDILGNVVFEMEQNVSAGQFTQEVNLADQAKGVYFIEVMTADQRTVRRVSIQ